MTDKPQTQLENRLCKMMHDNTKEQMSPRSKQSYDKFVNGTAESLSYKLGVRFENKEAIVSVLEMIFMEGYDCGQVDINFRDEVYKSETKEK